MFSIKLDIKPQSIPTTMTFTDDSTGNETIVSAFLTITKIDLIEKNYTFSAPFTIGAMTQDIDFLDKDYAINLLYSVTTNDDTYTKLYEFVTLGYSNLIKKNREFVLVHDLSIQDQERFKKESLDINYNRMLAKDRCRFSDLIGAQKYLDNIVDMNLDSKYTNCITC